MSESGAQEIERLSVAPMMEITDRHYRWMVRQIAPKTRLFTEMITTWALIHGRRLDLLDFDAAERPLALQLGGDDPAALATCARIAEDLGYDEVNLNVGCPSPRVQAGCFGVSLMGRPERVAECVAAMRAVVRVPVTVKHRIGFDELDAYEDMLRFVDVAAAAGCRHFYVHARKAWLSGLSPKDNRNVPPLRYADVHRLKRERPGLWIAINGGLRSEDEITSQLEHVDGVMVGRGAAEDPMSLHALERVVFGACSGLQDPMHVAERMVAYAERASVAGVSPRHVIRHALPLLQGRPGARQWRRAITEGLGAGRGPELLTEAIRAYRGGLGERRGSDAGVHVD